MGVDPAGMTMQFGAIAASLRSEPAGFPSLVPFTSLGSGIFAIFVHAQATNSRETSLHRDLRNVEHRQEFRARRAPRSVS